MDGRGKAEEEIRQLSAAEVEALLKRDTAAMGRLWSDDFVVTNPLNQFVTKKQVLGMVDSGFLVIVSFDRQLDYLKAWPAARQWSGAGRCRTPHARSIFGSRPCGCASTAAGCRLHGTRMWCRSGDVVVPARQLL